VSNVQRTDEGGTRIPASRPVRWKANAKATEPQCKTNVSLCFPIHAIYESNAACSTPPIQQSVATHNFTPSKQIPHLNYSVLKEATLKKKISELGIPTWGSRQLLIRRHTQWVDIFNANCDSPRPRSNRELLKELDIWERTQGGHAPGQGQSVPTGVMKKDFDGADWSGKHKDQFNDLIAQARIRAREKKEEKEAATSGGTTVYGNEPPPLSNQDSNIPDIIPSIETNAPSGSTAHTSRPSEVPIPTLSILSSAAQDLHPRHTTPPTLCSEQHSLQINEPPPPSAQQGSEPLSGKFVSPQTVKRLPTFQAPEDPIQDVDGIWGGNM
jgi:E3 ubiquitin-protein ligase RAD18